MNKIIARLIKKANSIEENLKNLFNNSELVINNITNTINGQISIFDAEHVTNFYFIKDDELYYDWFEKYCSPNFNDKINIKNNIIEDFSFNEDYKKLFFESEIDDYEYEYKYRRSDSISDEDLNEREYAAETFVENINIIYDKLQKFINEITAKNK